MQPASWEIMNPGARWADEVEGTYLLLPRNGEQLNVQDTNGSMPQPPQAPLLTFQADPQSPVPLNLDEATRPPPLDMTLGSAFFCRPGLPLDEEVHQFITALMAPDGSRFAVRLGAWQSELQVRCQNRDLRNPFWRFVVYDLNVDLHVEIELFIRTLFRGAWPLHLLRAWQMRLRGLTRRYYFPRRRWYALTHRAHVERIGQRIPLSLSDFLAPQGPDGTDFQPGSPSSTSESAG